jgi:hypothetical protein
MFIHYLTIPLYPWLEKNISSDIDKEIIDYLNLNKNNLSLNQIVNLNLQSDKKIIINISYIDIDFIDFSIDYNYKHTYSIEFKTNTIYLYKRSCRPITEEGFLYIDIDSNDNFNNNIQVNSSNIIKKFNYKVYPTTVTSSYVYYKAIGEFLLKTLNELVNVDYLNINIYNAAYTKLSNNYINKKLVDEIHQNRIKNCNCTFDDINASCYCNYIRHPLNKNNQIDISFKIGIIKNELITNIFN